MRTKTDQHTHVIRADAFQGLGTGHIMRCLALGQELMTRGDHVVFMTHCEYSAIIQRLQQEKCEVIILKDHYPAENDLPILTKTLSQIDKLGAVIADGYHFDKAYHLSVRDLGATLLVIDDFHHLPTYAPDLLLNQNINAQEIKYELHRSQLLLGTKYALIRKEFLLRPQPETISREVNNILITMGGEDTYNVTLKALKALANSETRASVTIVAGAANPNTDSLKSEIATSPLDITLLQSVNDMATLLEQTDLCISAGGATCWELCLYGIPAILISTADNQLGIVQGLDENSAAIYAGWHADVSITRLTELSSTLLESPKRRKQLSHKAMKLVDGKGATRVADKIYETLHT